LTAVANLPHNFGLYRCIWSAVLTVEYNYELGSPERAILIYLVLARLDKVIPESSLVNCLQNPPGGSTDGPRCVYQLFP